MSKCSTYHLCAVPECKNNSVKTPDKLWIPVPTDINMRKTWFKVARRGPELLSGKTRLYFCEDHFDLEHDMENYIQYKIMGSVKRIRLKPRCIPSRFGWNRKHAEAKKLRISTSEDSVQDYLKEDNVKASSCRSIEDSQTALAVPSMENKCDKAVLDNQVQEHIATQVVLSQKHKAIQACRKAQYRSKQEDSLQTENEINVFCPKCNTEVSHTTEGIQEDQTKLLIANVYHYFEREYEELKTIYGDLDLTPLLKFCQRTALATGVSETTVLQILKEEEGRNADKRQQPPVKRRKRSRQMDRAQTAVVKIEPEYYNAEPEIYFPAAVKVEPSDIELHTEQAQTDPISLHVKTEPRSDVVDDTNETLALIEPAGTKRKARVIPRSDVTPTRQHTRGDSSTAAAASSVRVKVKEEVDESSLFGDTEIKVEEIEIHEEGVG